MRQSKLDLGYLCQALLSGLPELSALQRILNVVTPRSCYAPVFVDDILTNGTQPWGSKSEKMRCFGLLVRNNAVQARFVVLNMYGFIRTGASCLERYPSSDRN